MRVFTLAAVLAFVLMVCGSLTFLVLPRAVAWPTTASSEQTGVVLGSWPYGDGRQDATIVGVRCVGNSTTVLAYDDVIGYFVGLPRNATQYPTVIKFHRPLTLLGWPLGNTYIVDSSRLANYSAGCMEGLKG